MRLMETSSSRAYLLTCSSARLKGQHAQVISRQMGRPALNMRTWLSIVVSTAAAANQDGKKCCRAHSHGQERIEFLIGGQSLRWWSNNNKVSWWVNTFKGNLFNENLKLNLQFFSVTLACCSCSLPPSSACIIWTRAKSQGTRWHHQHNN